MRPWTMWMFWADPLSYAQNAVAINEFNAPRWQIYVSSTVWGTSCAVLSCTALQWVS